MTMSSRAREQHQREWVAGTTVRYVESYIRSGARPNQKLIHDFVDLANHTYAVTYGMPTLTGETDDE